MTTTHRLLLAHRRHHRSIGDLLNSGARQRGQGSVDLQGAGPLSFEGVITDALALTERLRASGRADCRVCVAQTWGTLMVQAAADILIDVLAVECRYRLRFSGDGINGIMEALRTRRDKIRFVQGRHEEAAAFMACAYAKFTGRLGVCVATSGPGGVHLLNGLYDAKLDGRPVLAITGMP